MADYPDIWRSMVSSLPSLHFLPKMCIRDSLCVFCNLFNGKHIYTFYEKPFFKSTKIDKKINDITPVSYTHLDVYKRQTVVSVFVNPIQFNDKNDLEKYPRTLDADCRLLEECGADFAFAPSVSEMYPEPDLSLIHI